VTECSTIGWLKLAGDW